MDVKKESIKMINYANYVTLRVQIIGLSQPTTILLLKIISLFACAVWASAFMAAFLLNGWWCLAILPGLIVETKAENRFKALESTRDTRLSILDNCFQNKETTNQTIEKLGFLK